MINIIKIRLISYTLSLLIIFLGMFFIYKHGMKFSTEFTGGTTISFKVNNSSKEQIYKIIKNIIKDETTVINIKTNKSTTTVKISKSIPNNQIKQIQSNLKQKYPSFMLEDLIVVEPSVGKELINKTLIAVILSITVIFLFVWKSFGEILSSTAAIIAMLHDVVVLIGIFAIFSYFFNAEVNLLIVTAILTLLSFSLYDTIVIFDEIRKIKKKQKADNLEVLKETINKAVSNVFVRSINNSITSIIALFSLAIFVNGDLFWFSTALLIGVILGTYSSPFIAATSYYDIKKFLIKRKNK